MAEISITDFVRGAQGELDEDAGARVPTVTGPPEPGPRGPAVEPEKPADPATGAVSVGRPELSGGILDFVEQSGGKPVSTADVFKKSFTKGATAGGAITAGAVAGANVGARIPIPGSTLLGGLAGAGAGYLAYSLADETMQDMGLAPEPGDVPDYSLFNTPEEKHRRIAGITGEVLGAGVGAGGAAQALGLARFGGALPESTIGRVIDRVLTYSREHPYRFAVTEGHATISSAAGEGLYEIVRPGRPAERAGFGIVAGVLNPMNITAKTGTKIFDVLNSARQRFSASGRATLAAKEMQRLIEKGKLDPNVLVGALGDALELAGRVEGFKEAVTAGGLGVPLLREIESNLANMDLTFFSKNRAQAIQQAQNALNNTIKFLEITGEPDALRLAVSLRQQRYENMLDRMLGYAEVEARQAAEKVAGRGAALDAGSRATQQADISNAVFDVYQRQLDLSRRVERQLWEKALGGADEPGIHSGFRRMYNKLLGETTDVVPMPGEVTSAVQRVQRAREVIAQHEAFQAGVEGAEKVSQKQLRAAQKQLSVGKMLDLRRDLLAKARGQARSTDPSADRLARIYGLMAESVLSDLTRIGRTTTAMKVGGAGSRFGLTTADRQVRRAAGGRFTSETTDLDEARAYTQALNETFSRSFAGRLAQETAFGLQVPPDTMMRSAFASGREKAAMQLRELEDAISFLPPVVRNTNPEMARLMTEGKGLYLDLQARYLRLLADEVRDPRTGQYSSKRLAAFMDKHKAIVDRFDDVKLDLENALSSQERFEDWAKRASGIKKRLQTDAVGKLLKSDSPVDALDGMMRQHLAVEQMDRVLGRARATGPEAVDGFRRALWEVALTKAGLGRGEFNAAKFIEFLDTPIRPGSPTLRQYMASRDLLPDFAQETLDNVSKLGANLQAAVSQQVTGEEVVEQTNMFLNLVTRAAGSFAARTGADLALGAIGKNKDTAMSLMLGYRGAEIMQQFVERIPRLKIKDIMIDAFSGVPAPGSNERFGLLRLLMENATTPIQQARVVAKLHAYAWTAGILGARDEYREDFPTIRQFQGDEDEDLPGFLQQSREEAERDAIHARVADGLRTPARDVPPAEGEEVTMGALTTDEFEDVVSDIKRDEGFRSAPYGDAGGHSIGYGRFLGQLSPEELRGMRVTPEEAGAFVEAEVERVSEELSQKIDFFQGLSSGRKRALVNMGYNLGISGLLNFKKMLSAMRYNDFDQAAVEALDSQWAEQVGPRAQRIAALIRGD